MKLHWLLPGTVGTIFMLSSSAMAAKLESWRFDASQNRLVINTSGSVQPQAQLIFNPTRLVIDLPGTQFGQRQKTQVIGGAIRAVRVGQFNPETARLVVELSSGYTIDPNQVKFVGTTPNNWTVQLPKPTLEKVASSQDNDYTVVTVDSNSQTKQESTQVAKNKTGETQIKRLRITGDGFFIPTSGGNPKVKIKRSRNRRRIHIDISKATLAPELDKKDIKVNKHGVRSIKFSQYKNNPAVVRMTLRVDKNSPNWRASVSSFGGVVLLPNRTGGSISSRTSSGSSGSSSQVTVPSRPSSSSGSTAAVKNSISTIESVELSNDGTQLRIRSDRPLSASGGWDRSSAMFRITIPNAKLDRKVKGPSLNANSPILRLRLQQQDSNTVVIYIQPAARVQIGRLRQIGQLLALDLRRSGAVRPPIGLPPLPRPNPRPSPDVVRRPLPTPSRRPVPKGRLVVIIDPGHGGKDSGAIGRGGIREKDIILPISRRVAQILEKNGVRAVLTRRSDYFVSLKGRVDMAERVDADVFVSIHANSIGLSRPEVNGLETYYYNTGLGLARTVHNSIRRSVNVRNRGVRRARFYVLRKSSMPAILVETGYVTGREDAVKLKNSWYRNKMAEGIANGILEYLKRR
ncbi:MAG: N-acetylmuramoyl-L-alanine amidase [Nostocaceae cyanobacterium]|nr:N-acetylmuramoyl-L-alanine amidase [Nostocaceae cyanobacterium]